MEFPYPKRFESAEVHDFQDFKALSVGSYEGHFILSLLTATAVKTLTRIQPLDVHAIFVGCLVADKLFGFSLPTIASVNLFM